MIIFGAKETSLEGNVCFVMDNITNLYSDIAWIYDIEFGIVHPVPDVPFYLEYAVCQCGKDGMKGDILELGCGTGRVAMILAENGFNVTGFDLSQPMLDVFRKKLSAIKSTQPEIAERIKIIQNDMTNFSIARKFSLIIAPFRVFQALPVQEDFEKALIRVREHLSDDGIFIINIQNPDDDLFDEEFLRAEEFNDEIFDEKTGITIARYDCLERIDSLNQVIHGYYAYIATYPDGHIKRLIEPLKLKYYYRNQLRDLMEYAGFKIIDEYSWYDKSPPDLNPPGSSEIIMVCKKIYK